MSARTARMVLVDPDGALLGSLPPVEVAMPWWQEVEPVVAAVRARFGIAPVILRLLEANRAQPPGGLVTYLAEVPERPPAALPWHGALPDDPKRLAYARPGGPAADLYWARREMTARGIAAAGAPVQVRTWNLASLWRLPSSRGTLWLKIVPPFAAPEGAVIERLRTAALPVPPVVAHDAQRLLTEEIPGVDLYEARGPVLFRMVELLVRAQARLSVEPEDLLEAGLPDGRWPTLEAEIGATVEGAEASIGAELRLTLQAFVSDLPSRFAAIDSCGIGTSFVHGDFYPGNVRGHGDTLTLLDFADACVAHPLLDMAAFLDRIPDPDREPVRRYWTALWRSAAPGSDPDRAAALLAPVSAARQATLYRHFLESIEPSEHPYHSGDVEAWLVRCGELVRSE